MSKPCWREAKAHAEKEEAAGEVAAWLVVGFVLLALVGLFKLYGSAF